MIENGEGRPEPVEAARGLAERLIADGVIVRDRDGLGTRLQEEMRDRLAQGPAEASPAELDEARYQVADPRLP
ncbi:hypothetical protein AB0L06_26900 [Spirillospora sp. NPDC052269]